MHDQPNLWCWQAAAWRLLAAAVLGLWLSGCAHTSGPPVGSQAAPPAQTAVARALWSQAEAWAGVPYRYGGMDRRGVDCSAFVQLTLRERLGRSVPRTTALQARAGTPIAHGDMQPGDVVFFRNPQGSRHVGLYLGEGAFVHASQSRGVIVSRLDSGYWAPRFVAARRL